MNARAIARPGYCEERSIPWPLPEAQYVAQRVRAVVSLKRAPTRVDVTFWHLYTQMQDKEVSMRLRNYTVHVALSVYVVEV